MRLDLTPGTVVALAGETARFTAFWLAFQNLAGVVPQESAIRCIVGSDIAESRNQAVAELHGDWVWFIDDDHTFSPQLLLQLLARNVDVVAPLCLRRNSPFLPVAAVDGDFLDVTRYGPDELVEVEHTGSSGMLIRKRVLEALEPPWFELGHDDQGRRVSEDVGFCQKARAAGFLVHVDTAARLRHLTIAAVFPEWSEQDGRWLTGFDVADGAQLWIEPTALQHPATEDEAVEPPA